MKRNPKGSANEVKRKPVPINEIIEAFLDKNLPKEKNIKIDIVDNWENIVSKKAAKYTKPILIKNKVLLIHIANSAWMHQLTLNKKAILGEIQEIVGEKKIKDIRFKIGRV